MSDEAARKKYDQALRNVQSAKALLLEARKELAPLIGAEEQRRLLFEHYCLTERLWISLAYSYARGEIRLSSVGGIGCVKGE